MIRDYREEDWEQVASIYDLSKPDELKGIVDRSIIKPLVRDERMLQYFTESRILVFVEEGCVFGFIGRKDDVISWLFVHPDHRRKGIARSLLNELFRNHQGPLRLNLVKNNLPAMILYKNYGFEVYEEFTGSMYGSPIPAVRMKLNREEEK